MSTASSMSPEGVQDWQVTYELWRHSFSTQIPDRAVSHTFVQPIDCLIPNPRPRDTNWVARNLQVEGRCGSTSPDPPAVPGCLLGIEPATCLRTQPAGRTFTPFSTSETGSKSSAGSETPPLVHLLPVGPCALPVSDHELVLPGAALPPISQDELRPNKEFPPSTPPRAAPLHPQSPPENHQHHHNTPEKRMKRERQRDEIQ